MKRYLLTLRNHHRVVLASQGVIRERTASFGLDPEYSSRRGARL
jgi:hypothetical protein